MRSSAGPWLIEGCCYSPRPEETKDRMVTRTREIGHQTAGIFSQPIYGPMERE